MGLIRWRREGGLALRKWSRRVSQANDDINSFNVGNVMLSADFSFQEANRVQCSWSQVLESSSRLQRQKASLSNHSVQQAVIMGVRQPFPSAKRTTPLAAVPPFSTLAANAL